MKSYPNIRRKDRSPRSLLLRLSLTVAKVYSFACVIAIASQWAQNAPDIGSVTAPMQDKSCPDFYCAETSRKLLPERPYVPPKANEVFHDPEFGSRMIRATDEKGIDGNLQGFSFISNSSAEINEWGKFDPKLGPNGGYYFYVMTGGGGAVLFSMDAATMQVTPHCGSFRSCRMRAGGTFSYVDPHILYGEFDANNLITSYDVAKGKQSTIYDFSKCPNLPNDLSGYPGAISNSGDDTKFAAYAGGKGQGGGNQITYYDRSTGRCYWYDTGSGRLGSSQMQTVQLQFGLLNAPAMPELKSAAGDLPPGDYYVQLSATIRRPTGTGETLPSPEAHIRLNSRGGIEVSLPEIDNLYKMALTGFRVYIGTASGKESLQYSAETKSTFYTQTVALVGGSRPPTSTTAGFNVHNARISRDGMAVKITPAGANTLFFWFPQTATVTACSTGGEGHAGVSSFCGGHTVLGYSHLINNGGPGSTFSLLDRPLSNLNEFTRLVPAEDSVPLGMDTHWSWNNDDPADTTPVCGAFSGRGAGTVGDGSRNPATNPLMSVRQAWDREIVCVATSGPPKVWRFAHHHSTGACNANAKVDSCFGSIAIGNVSQDGRFYLFSSDWDWSLGSEPRDPGCPTAGRCRADVFIVELK